MAPVSEHAVDPAKEDDVDFKFVLFSVNDIKNLVRGTSHSLISDPPISAVWSAAFLAAAEKVILSLPIFDTWSCVANRIRGDSSTFL